MSETGERYDIAIIGAGMAGASLAAKVAPHASVVMIEAERQPGHHATGRSAAFWEETYGGPEIFPLTSGSGPYLREGGFLLPRGALYIARDEDLDELHAFLGEFADLGADLETIDHAAATAMVPGLRSEWRHAVWSPSCSDIDVAGLHAHFLGLAARGGAVTRLRSRVVEAERRGSDWALKFENGEGLSAGIVVNAAGAWADEVAQIMGAAPVGITPMRRTVVQLRCDPPAGAAMPLVLDIKGNFYFKPESGRIWLSPHDETPSPPCDAAPEELDVAIAIDRMEHAVDWRIEAVERKWAGLRSFAPDRCPVYGFDGDVPGFFWCAGQGGFGIQTAPAAADLAAALLLNREAQGAARGIDPAPYRSDRFR